MKNSQQIELEELQDSLYKQKILMLEIFKQVKKIDSQQLEKWISEKPKELPAVIKELKGKIEYLFARIEQMFVENKAKTVGGDELADALRTIVPHHFALYDQDDQYVGTKLSKILAMLPNDEGEFSYQITMLCTEIQTTATQLIEKKEIKKDLEDLNDPVLSSKIKNLETNLNDLISYAKNIEDTNNKKSLVISIMVDEISRAKAVFLHQQAEARENIKKDLQVAASAKEQLINSLESKTKFTEDGFKADANNFMSARSQELKITLEKHGYSAEKVRVLLGQFEAKCTAIIDKGFASYCRPDIDKASRETNLPFYKDHFSVLSDGIITAQTYVLTKSVSHVDSCARKTFKNSCQHAYQKAQPTIKESSDSLLKRCIGRLALTLCFLVGAPVIKWAFDYKRTGGEWVWPWTTQTISQRKSERAIESVKELAKPSYLSG